MKGGGLAENSGGVGEGIFVREGSAAIIFPRGGGGVIDLD